MKEKIKKEFSCSLKNCLNFEKGKCSIAFVPFINELVPSSIKCKFFDDDFQKSLKEFKSKGGMQGAIARLCGRKTEEEIAEAKKLKRKPRADKGKKRKKETTLEELM